MPDEYSLMRPVINLNGTSRESLIKDRTAALDALQEALEAVRATYPHGRDYVGKPERFKLAQLIHANRVGALEKMHREIMAEAVWIQEEGT